MQFIFMPSFTQQKKKPKRAYIFWIFIIIAIPLAVVLLGYASGYRIDGLSKTIIKTSALSIYTTPSNAHITINDSLLNETTPFIQTFQPGTYHILVSKDGYYDWETTTSIDSNTSALFAHVVLFPKSSLTLEDALPDNDHALRAATQNEITTLGSLLIQPTDDVRMLVGDQTLVVDNTKKQYLIYDNSLHELLYSDSGNVVSADWNDHVLLIATDKEISTYDANTKLTTLVTRQTTPITDAVFTPEGTHIIFSDSNGLYAIEAYPHNVHVQTQLSTESGIENLRISKNPEKVYLTLSGKIFSLALEK